MLETNTLRVLSSQCEETDYVFHILAYYKITNKPIKDIYNVEFTVSVCFWVHFLILIRLNNWIKTQFSVLNTAGNNKMKSKYRCNFKHRG